MNELTIEPPSIAVEDRANGDFMLSVVYDELRRLAARHLAREKPGQTLQATALVHEAYLRLADSASPGTWHSRGHFFIAAAEAMRRILIESARRKHCLKRGGARRRLRLEEVDPAVISTRDDDLLDLDAALEKLEAEDPAKAALVKLRFYAGLSLDEAADALGISRATASRHWRYAKAHLFCELNSPDDASTPSEFALDR
ncbi:MAG: ECF-type sigma factor [Isosphaeraceae bacterium]|nr:ECF-type sigma factor [Isosphaeraceae bacterium]